MQINRLRLEVLAETGSVCEGAYKRLHVSIAFVDKWVSFRSLRWGDRSTWKVEQWRQCARAAAWLTRQQGGDQANGT